MGDTFDVSIAQKVLPPVVAPPVQATTSTFNNVKTLMMQNHIIAIIIVLVIIIICAMAFFFYQREKKKTVVQEQIRPKPTLRQKKVAEPEPENEEEPDESKNMHDVLVENMSPDDIKRLREKVTSARKTFDERFQTPEAQPIEELKEAEPIIETKTICDWEENGSTCTNYAVDNGTRCNTHNI
jgi:hypothetical protein